MAHTDLFVSLLAVYFWWDGREIFHS